MLPYLAQGANSSLEDGAVLGLLLGHMKNQKQLPHILRLYQSLRKSRGEAIVRETFKQVRMTILYFFLSKLACFGHRPNTLQRHDFHMEDGEEQQKRDEIFTSQLGKKIEGAFPSRW